MPRETAKPGPIRAMIRAIVKFEQFQPMQAETPQNDTTEGEDKKTRGDPREVLRQLQEASPTFRDCKPLALGIDKAVSERFPEFDRKSVRTAMRMHVNSTRYLKAVEKATERFDLDGNVAGEITDEHRGHAAQTLKERFAAVAKRKRDEQKEQQERERAEQAEQRKAERLNQLVGKFSKR
jgi:ProP effector